MLLVCKERYEIDMLKSQFKERFKMKDLGPTKRILGIITNKNTNKSISRLPR